MTRRAFVVVDLGFGDAGKGLVTDFLARRGGAHTVVRFNGGAQAGHNVVTPDGRHHTFAQLGAGTFVAGVRTHLSRFVIVHPTALALEAAQLARVGVDDALARLSIASEALVITPFHQATGRLRELSRGAARHGSCGVGVGEAVACALAGEALHARDLFDAAALHIALARIRDRQRAEVEALGAIPGEAADRERAIFEVPSVIDVWMERVDEVMRRTRVIDDDEARAELHARPGALVMEGAQGVLLDEHHGFHPHTTWSTCTPDNALAWLQGFEGDIHRLGVLRTFATRHGPGPFPTEDDALAPLVARDHNVEGPWQGRLRVGWPDLVLARYALDACRGLDGLALTHLDALSTRVSWRACVGYDGAEGPRFAEDGARIAVAEGDLAAQEALGRALASVRPRYAELEAHADRVVEAFERALALPVVLTSEGPSSTHVRWRDRAPSTNARMLAR
jgi:adenylosuccinate synthase